MALRLMAVLAHPDDESLGFGGTLATYAAAGVETLAGDGDARRGRPLRRAPARHAGPSRARGAGPHPRSASCARRPPSSASATSPSSTIATRSSIAPTAREGVARIVHHLRRIRPDVVAHLRPGRRLRASRSHRDLPVHRRRRSPWPPIRRSRSGDGDAPHRVAKLYYIAWPASTWAAYEDALKRLISVVDGVERQAVPWPDWSITTVIDTRASWETVWRAVSCHATQMGIFARLKDLSPELHQALWGAQSFYRVLSTVNGGRQRGDRPVRRPTLIG